MAYSVKSPALETNPVVVFFQNQNISLVKCMIMHNSVNPSFLYKRVLSSRVLSWYMVA